MNAFDVMLICLWSTRNTHTINDFANILFLWLSIQFFVVHSRLFRAGKYGEKMSRGIFKDTFLQLRFVQLNAQRCLRFALMTSSSRSFAPWHLASRVDQHRRSDVWRLIIYRHVVNPPVRTSWKPKLSNMYVVKYPKPKFTLVHPRDSSVTAFAIIIFYVISAVVELAHIIEWLTFLMEIVNIVLLYVSMPMNFTDWVADKNYKSINWVSLRAARSTTFMWNGSCSFR